MAVDTTIHQTHQASRALPHRLVLGAFVLAVLTFPALSGAEQAAAATPPTGAPIMMDNGGRSRTGNVDFDFAVNLREHHRIGLLMAEAQSKDGKGTAMNDLAYRLAESLKKDIAELDRWIDTNDPAKPSPSGY